MLTIHNNPDGTIADTDYWQSEYNTRNLAYLSGHTLSLRLLLPTVAGAAWLPDIKTGKRVLIESPVRPGYLNHIDIVFDDDTDNPFSLCIDCDQQIDQVLRSGQTRLMVYLDGLLILNLPCQICLSNEPAQTYLAHVTTTTGHNRRSYRDEVRDDIVAMVKEWLQELYAGASRGLVDDKYAVRCEWHNSMAAAFIVSRLNDQMEAVDIVKIAVCNNGRNAPAAWKFAEGTGTPLLAPFVAAGILTDQITPDDLPYIGVIADFERCLGWAWLESPRR